MHLEMGNTLRTILLSEMGYGTPMMPRLQAATHLGRSVIMTDTQGKYKVSVAGIYLHKITHTRLPRITLKKRALEQWHYGTVPMRMVRLLLLYLFHQERQHTLLMRPVGCLVGRHSNQPACTVMLGQTKQRIGIFFSQIWKADWVSFIISRG